MARGRNSIAVSGTAAQVEATFQTEIHNYLSDGEVHFANASEPSVPAALGSVVRAIRGLNDYRMKPRPSLMKPHYTEARGTHYLAPGDLATIYDFAPLYTAGINGTGQKIAIAGQVVVNLSDITQFRSMFSLPNNTPQTVLVPGSRNPGSNSSDLAESDLDLEWSGAAAQNATILFVYSTDVMTSVQYAIDQDLAPVVSVSYGECELEAPSSDVASFQQWAQQANRAGNHVVRGIGRQRRGGLRRYAGNPGLGRGPSRKRAQVTSVGGTEFVEGPGTYWSRTNNANGASVLSCVPETAWNDSVEEGSRRPARREEYHCQTFLANRNRGAQSTMPESTGVALNASADHDRYLVYTGESLQAYGGTSVPTPSFAG